MKDSEVEESGVEKKRDHLKICVTDRKRARKQPVQETKGEVDAEKNKALSKLFFFACLRDRTGPGNR